MKKSIKTIGYFWKQFIISSLVIFCILALGFCMFKITYSLLTKPIPISKPTKWSSTQPSRESLSKNWVINTNTAKKLFPITLDEFEPVLNQKNLEEGQNYFIIKALDSVDTKSQCVYGNFKLLKKESKKFLFKTINEFSGNKIEHFSQIINEHVKFLVLEGNQVDSKIKSCKNWFFVENKYEDFTNLNIDTIMQLKRNLPKCTQMPNQTVFAKSFSPNIVYFQFNSLTSKLMMCTRSHGTGIIQTLELKSGQFLLTKIIVSKSEH